MSRNSLLIEGLGSNGDGRAQLAGKPVYVPYALPGEVVKLGGGQGQLAGEMSPQRIMPLCPHHGNLQIDTQVLITSPPQGGEGNAALIARSATISEVGEGECRELDEMSTFSLTPTADPLTLVPLSAEALSSSSPLPHMGGEEILKSSVKLQTACGGCRMQHLADPAYRDWKRGLVIYALRHLGIAPEIVGPLQVSPPKSRRRASFSALRRHGKTALGFMQRGTNIIVDMRVCFVLQPAILALVEPLRALPILREGEGASYVVTCLDRALEVLIERKRPLDLAERELLAEFANLHELARLAWRATARDAAEPVAYREPLLAKFGEATVPLPPGAFLQATTEGEAALVAAVLAGLPQGPVIDLFAGCGTFSFPAAKYGLVTAYEGNKDAVASINAARQPNVKALHRNLFSDPVAGGELAGFTAAIFDPPYAGAASQVAELAKSQLKTIIGVSCNPQSFARDAAVLVEAGYRLTSVTPVDQFLWAADVELVGVFRR